MESECYNVLSIIFLVPARGEKYCRNVKSFIVNTECTLE